MEIQNIRTFLPCKDFLVSKQFYLDLGFPVLWESEELICFGTEKQNFFLQAYYNKDLADNFMMQLHVSNIETLYKRAEKLVEIYKGTKIKPIFLADYGRTFHLIDPTGVLWHMTEFDN